MRPITLTLRRSRFGGSTLFSAPTPGRTAFLLGKGPGAMAQRQEARGFGNVQHLPLRMGKHRTFGKFNAQTGNPISETDVERRVDVFRKIGAVGAELERKVLERKPRLAVAFGIHPFPDAQGEVRMVGRHLTRNGLRHSSLVEHLGIIRHPMLLLDGTLHCFIKEHVVLVAAIEIDVERDGGKDPNIDITVGEEGEQSAPNTEDDCPIGKDGEPTDVGPDIVGLRILEHTDGLAVRAEYAHGKEDAVDHQPEGQHRHPTVLENAAGKTEEQHTRQGGIAEPHAQMDEAATRGEITVVEECHHARTEEPVAKEIGDQVHHNGGAQVRQTDGAEKMHAVVGGKHQQRRTHKAARKTETVEDLLLRRPCKEHVEAEEEHQRQGYAERIMI